jgi:hypothetical protein
MEVELQQEAKDSFDPTIKRVELLYDESIRLQNALAKLSHMTGNLHRILNSRGMLAQDLSNMIVDNRRQSVVSGSSHYLPLSLSQNILETETPLETPTCTDFSVMLAQAIDKHRDDALSKSGQQKFTSQELANLNDIAEQDAIIQLEEELQQKNKRLKTTLIELSLAMSVLYSALVDSRREPKPINEGPSVKADMMAATTTNSHAVHNKKERGKSRPKLTPIDCELVDDDELRLGFNDPLLSSPGKNKIKVDDASKVGPEHCTNMITSTLKKKNMKEVIDAFKRVRNERLHRTTMNLHNETLEIERQPSTGLDDSLHGKRNLVEKDSIRSRKKLKSTTNDSSVVVNTPIGRTEAQARGD